MRFTLLGVVLAALTFVACGSSKGTCEFKYAEASQDGSIPAGLEVCTPGWVSGKCNERGVDNGSVGLKMTGFKFTKGGECESLGYKDCSGGRGAAYYKQCPK